MGNPLAVRRVAATKRIHRAWRSGFYRFGAVLCEGGQHLTVERHKPEQDALIPKGSSVFIRIPFESILLFDPDTGQRA